jgi:hypothetical protein
MGSRRATSPSIDLGLDLRRLLTRPQLGADKKYQQEQPHPVAWGVTLLQQTLVQGAS